EHRTSRTERQTWKMWKVASLVYYVVIVLVTTVGLIKSYSRGAWVGAAVTLGYLGYQAGKLTRCQVTRLSGLPGRTARGWLRRNCVTLAAAVLALLVITFCAVGEREQPTVRRAFSVANEKDFSWRNRLMAYEGASQIIATRLWFGFGWSQPERV